MVVDGCMVNYPAAMKTAQQEGGLPPKAQSVDRSGAPDGYIPPMAYKAQVVQGGFTRLIISCPPSRLAMVHSALVKVLRPPLKFLYVRMTDRQSGKQLPKPEHHVSVDLTAERVAAALVEFTRLIHHDGRNQVWVRGSDGDQIVLEELGGLFAYPDDLGFRDAMDAMGLVNAQHQSIDERDYVKVNFLAEADDEERRLMQSLALTSWNRG